MVCKGGCHCGIIVFEARAARSKLLSATPFESGAIARVYLPA